VRGGPLRLFRGDRRCRNIFCLLMGRRPFTMFERRPKPMMRNPLLWLMMLAVCLALTGC